MHVRQEGFLAQLLGDPEDAGAELGCRRGVSREELSQLQQARGLAQTPEVLGVLRHPRAEHRGHGPEGGGTDEVSSHLLGSTANGPFFKCYAGINVINKTVHLVLTNSKTKSMKKHLSKLKQLA